MPKARPEALNEVTVTGSVSRRKAGGEMLFTALPAGNIGYSSSLSDKTQLLVGGQG